MSLSFNWIDIVIAAIFIRGIFVGLKSNIVIEIFRLIGLFCTTFIALHFYIHLADFLTTHCFIPENVSELLAFILLWVSGVLVFKLIGEGWKLLLRIEPHPAIDKWASLIVSIIRSFLICGMTFMMLFISRNVYLGKISNRSFSGKAFMDISPDIYKFCYDNFVRKYFPDENLNVKVFKLKELGQKAKKKKKK